MIADKNTICTFCDSFILRGEEYSDVEGCGNCNHIVRNMIEDNKLLGEYLSFNKYITINNIPFEERVIK